MEQVQPLRRQIARWDRRFDGKAEVRCQISSENIGNFDLDWLTPNNVAMSDNASKKLLLYFHGGAYCLRSPHMYRWFISGYCQKLSVQAAMPDYRLTPEHKHPSAIEDCFAAYQHVLEQGYQARNIALAGDSAGGGLVLSVLKMIRDKSLSMPASASLISPAGDWTMSGSSFYENDGRDPLFHLSSLLFYRQLYLGGCPPDDPLASPLFTDFNGFPPLYLCAGSTELMRDIATGVAAKANAAGVNVTLEVWPGLCHVFPLMSCLPESQIANDKITGFIARHWD